MPDLNDAFLVAGSILSKHAEAKRLLRRANDAHTALAKQDENTVSSIRHSAGDLNGLDTFQRDDPDRKGRSGRRSHHPPSRSLDRLLLRDWSEFSPP